MANTTGQWHALMVYYGQHHRPVAMARSNCPFWPTLQAFVSPPRQKLQQVMSLYSKERIQKRAKAAFSKLEKQLLRTTEGSSSSKRVRSGQSRSGKRRKSGRQKQQQEDTTAALKGTAVELLFGHWMTFDPEIAAEVLAAAAAKEIELTKKTPLPWATFLQVWTAYEQRVVPVVAPGDECYELVRTLLRARCDVNVSDGDGNYPLHWAIAGTDTVLKLCVVNIRLTSRPPGPGQQQAGQAS